MSVVEMIVRPSYELLVSTSLLVLFGTTRPLAAPRCPGALSPPGASPRTVGAYYYSIIIVITTSITSITSIVKNIMCIITSITIFVLA